MAIGTLALVVLASAVVTAVALLQAERAPECPRCGRPTDLVDQKAEYVEGGWLIDSRQFACPICLVTASRQSLTDTHDL
jgi:hypothetical protein